MKVFGYAIVVALTANPVMGSLFFQESKADKIKANLQSIGYEIFDSAGLVKDSVFENLDPESIKDWLEAHGVTDASEQTLEYAKQHKDWLVEDIKDYAAQSQDFSTAMLQKGKEYYTQKSDDAAKSVWSTWSDSKLKEFLDARGVNVPQHSTRDELIALISRTKYKLPINFGGAAGKYWFDGWTRDELANKLQSLGENVDGTRKDLVQRLYASYSKAYQQGKDTGADAADKVKDVAGDWKEATVQSFNNWSLDDLKEYLGSFGAETSGTKDKLVQSAKENYYYFVHGEAPPKTPLEHIQKWGSNVASSVGRYFNKLLGIQAFVRSDL